MTYRLTTDKSRPTQGKRYGQLRWKPDRTLGEEAIHTACFSSGVMTEGTYVSTSTTFIPRTSTSKGALIDR